VSGGEASAFHAVTASVLETAADPAVVGARSIAAVIAAAKSAPNGRARLILHTDAADHLHEMVIALPVSSCDHPHINFKSGKSFLALSGRFAVMHCSDDGSTIKPTILSAGPWPGARMARLRAPAWHTIIPLDGDTVFLETIIGPFEGNRFAAWFPGESDPAGRMRFAEMLRDLARDAAALLTV
jgi:cupin fold WbuC family metalloprotein